MALSSRLHQILDAVYPPGPVWRPDREYDIPGAGVLDYVGRTIDVPLGGHSVTRHWVDGKGLVQYGGHFRGDPEIYARSWKKDPQGRSVYDDFLSGKAKTAGIWRIVGARFSFAHDAVAPSKHTPSVSPHQRIEVHHCYAAHVNDEFYESDSYIPTYIYWSLFEDHLNLGSQRNPNQRPRPGTPQGGGEIKHVAIEITTPPPRGVPGLVLKRDGHQKGIMKISHMFVLAPYLHRSRTMFQGRCEIGPHVYGWFHERTRLPAGVVNLRDEGVSLAEARELWNALRERWIGMHSQRWLIRAGPVSDELDTWADGTVPAPEPEPEPEEPPTMDELLAGIDAAWRSLDRASGRYWSGRKNAADLVAMIEADPELAGFRADARILLGASERIEAHLGGNGVTDPHDLLAAKRIRAAHREWLDRLIDGEPSDPEEPEEPDEEVEALKARIEELEDEVDKEMAGRKLAEHRCNVLEDRIAGALEILDQS